MTSSTLPSRKFHTLDGLRGLAAIGVVSYHAWPWISSFRPPSAYLAVDLFFLLSGFVLAHAYEHRFAAGMTSGQFLRVRLIRLYPLFLLSVLAAGAGALVQLKAGTSPISIRGISAAFASSVFMLPTPVVRAKSWLFPLNAPSWSLLLEAVVNIFYALFWRRLTNRVLVVLVAVTGAALVAVSLAEHGLDVGPYFESVGWGFVRLFFSFFLGVLLRRWEGGAQIRSPQPWIARLLLLGFVMAIQIPMPGKDHGVYDLVCAMVIFPALIWFGAKYEPASPLEKSICGWLGVTSYALYLLHFPIMTLIARCGASMVARWSGHPIMVDAVLITGFLVLAAASDRYYDVPVRKWLTAVIQPAPRGAALPPR